MKYQGQGFAILLSVSLLAAGLTGSSAFAAGKAEAFTGEVSDAMCGAQHMEPGATPADCTRTCVSKGAKYALVVGDKVYTLDGANKAALDELSMLAGRKAIVTGMVKDDIITVSSVAPGK